MSASFTDWEQDYLEHHGIKGMKWGVRRYQNEDGSLTPAGEKRYGFHGKGGSPRKLTKDYNNLDQGYANVEAYRKKNIYKTRKYASKAFKGSNNQKKLQKIRDKAIKYGKKAALNQKQKESIEKLQWKIIGKAAANGWSTTSEAVTRSGATRGQRIVSNLTNVDFGTPIDGQNISVRRYGNGKTNVINYNAAKSEAVQKIWKEERDKEIAEKYKNKRR